MAQVSFLDNQLRHTSMTCSPLKSFHHLEELDSFLKLKMVEMKKNISYPLVYSLVTLALILLVATVTVKRAFSAINIIKNRLRNQIGELSHIY